MNPTNESIRTDDVLTYALSSERNATQDIEFTVSRSLKRKKIQVYSFIRERINIRRIIPFHRRNI